jgi:hypothetical protein
MIIVAAVALIVLVAWIGHRALAPAVNVSSDKYESFMQRIAKEAGPTGDVSKLSPADRDEFLKSVAGVPRPPEYILQQSYKKYFGSK